MTDPAGFDLPMFFSFAAVAVIGLYVALDGFDLGVGVLFAFAPRAVDRDLMMASLEPFWDGNETWLVLGGMVLLAVFPLAFAIVLPAFYVPLALMLMGLVLRGVAFEFRSQGGALQEVWTAAFAAGSTLAAFCQGVILGAFVGGHLPVEAGGFAGGPFDWLSLFSVVTGLGVVAGYGLLGACWLIWKSDGYTQDFARKAALVTLACSGAAIAVVSIWTPLADPRIAARWFAWPDVVALAPLPIIAVMAGTGALHLIWGRDDWAPFVCALVLLLTALIGLAVSLWPWAVPGEMTIWQAASSRRTQVVVAGAVVAILPIVLTYMAFNYWTFRGKTRSHTQ